ncbi:hypothetical protein NM688_g3523 [Phlebia brevispora]|uniref:Uncharacterized protein n=1 Tax=Phlebia brevispora TaxID=194682 RepID=A0ACC1T5G0_9APHY|nr:hypothetical protein NM688_g3523 [Phlebia brevispora]
MAPAALPVELVSHALSALTSQDLLSCSLVSHTWHDLARPFLFQQITFTYHCDLSDRDSLTPLPSSYAEDETDSDQGLGEELVPEKTRRLTSLLDFLHFYPSIAASIRELRLVSRRAYERDTDPLTIMHILQCLHRLQILHVTDIVFASADAVSQARAQTGYQPMSLHQLHYSLTAEASLWTAKRRHRRRADSVWPLLELFHHANELHVHALELRGVRLLISEASLPSPAQQMSVGKLLASAEDLQYMCDVLPAVKLEDVRSLDLGHIGTSELPDIEQSLVSAINLEEFFCSIRGLFIGESIRLISMYLHPDGRSSSLVGGVPEDLRAFESFESSALRTFSLRDVTLNPFCIKTATKILVHVSRYLEGRPTSKSSTQMTVQLIFTDWYLNLSKPRVDSVPKLRENGVLLNLEPVLLELTTRRHRHAPVKLRLSHDSLGRAESRSLAALMFPRLDQMNAEFD